MDAHAGKCHSSVRVAAALSVTLVLTACGGGGGGGGVGGEGDPLPAAGPVDVPYLELTLARDGEFDLLGAGALAIAERSTELVQGLLLEHFGVGLVTSLHATVVNILAPDADPIAATYLESFRQYRIANFPVGAGGHRPIGYLFSGKTFTDVAVGLSFTSGPTSDFAVGLSNSTLAIVTGHLLGHNFGASHDTEPGFLMSTVSGGPTLSSASIAAIQATLDALPDPLPTLQAFPAQASYAAGSVTVTWSTDFGQPGSTWVLARSGGLVPLSCYSCVELASAHGMATDPSPTPGATNHYRVFERGAGGELLSMSQPLAVVVP